MDLNRLKKSIPDTRWMTIDTQLLLKLIAVVEAAKELDEDYTTIKLEQALENLELE